MSAAAARPVVILHGLWVPGPLLGSLRSRVGSDGFDARIYSYPSMRLTLRENAERLRDWCSALPAPPHFIAHSMGGLVVAAMLDIVDAPPTQAVFAGTPFAGCHAAHALRRYPGGASLLGRSMAEWIDGRRCIPDVKHEIGVIAGVFGAGLGRLIDRELPVPNDGVVAVEETHVPGERDHLIMNVAHSAMLFSPEVARQACAFIRHGRFDHGT